jgi:anti-sigma B factor antagonist
MDAEIQEFKRCRLVKVKGRVDSSNAQEFQSVMESLTDEGNYKLVLDMADITFLSSRGWWVLVQTQKNCKRYNRGELVLANIRNDIRESLDLVGLNLYFKIFDDTTGAVGFF